MKRRDFLFTSTLAALAMNDLYAFAKWSNSLPENGAKMPVLFIGHGSPMNAIEDNEFSRGWKSLAGKLPSPTAIVVVSNCYCGSFCSLGNAWNQNHYDGKTPNHS